VVGFNAVSRVNIIFLVCVRSLCCLVAKCTVRERRAQIVTRWSRDRGSAERIGATRLIAARRAGRTLTGRVDAKLRPVNAGPTAARDSPTVMFELASICADFECDYRRRRCFGIWIERTRNIHAPEAERISVLSECDRRRSGISMLSEWNRKRPEISVPCKQEESQEYPYFSECNQKRPGISVLP